ncbi:UDP-glucose dehydrogenase family protein [Solitalea canadensis]|uniref:UDP-glucose 6-dehydrogenase n=1 Tax=Solitalea canadensis (strain ATCC 29591 / DSM 3403 / JCM 21819 / LMG 8368 / NBRC 15130 / NCIMB 12057 / USAM 9D) TaxID=929556 RepID=H8KNP5_SOLCM|nr:UDP-glucose/GDP-mannose dehydrogenase family protein [Solitalea canadensis]AFD08178.1 nucleotide sugar dehydrogenase [Solitalea canadensis DSM 3403]
MKITIIGTGYVGLVTGTCLAETGNDVICVDNNVEKVASMQNGIIPFYEPGLESMFKRNIEQGRLTFTSDLAHGVNESLIIFLALPTPPAEDGSADLSYVIKVSEGIGVCMNDYKIIVNKSTVPVGTTELVRKTIRKYTDTEFDVVSNPEFLREGVAINDFMKPNRIVVGTRSEYAKKVFRELYEPYMRQSDKMIVMDERSAEITKYAANAFLAAKISFMNEISGICEKLGANIEDVRKGIGTDDRIGKQFLYAGIGYGGSCFPKDVLALNKIASDNDCEHEMVESIIKINQAQRKKFVNRIKSFFRGDLAGKTITLWGLSFKPETDDIREAPSIYIIDELSAAGARVVGYDPVAGPFIKSMFGDRVSIADDQYEALTDADALILVTEWSCFRNPNFDTIAGKLKSKVIFDGRNQYDLIKMSELGFNYFSVGRRSVVSNTSIHQLT